MKGPRTTVYLIIILSSVDKKSIIVNFLQKQTLKGANVRKFCTSEPKKSLMGALLVWNLITDSLL